MSSKGFLISMTSMLPLASTTHRSTYLEQLAEGLDGDAVDPVAANDVFAAGLQLCNAPKDADIALGDKDLPVRRDPLRDDQHIVVDPQDPPGNAVISVFCGREPKPIERSIVLVRLVVVRGTVRRLRHEVGTAEEEDPAQRHLARRLELPRHPGILPPKCGSYSSVTPLLPTSNEIITRAPALAATILFTRRHD